MFIKWDNKYSVKNALIDSQHKKLFELANAAHDMIGKQTNPNEVRKVLAALFDWFDGRVARFLQGSTKFGAELDSLSDFVSFGVAPAILLYQWSLSDLPKYGWFFCLLMAIGMSMRLARFNTMLDDEPQPEYWTHFFVGVPAPAAAALALMPLLISFDTPGLTFVRSHAFCGTLLCVVSFLMVSRIPTFSTKHLRVTKEGLFLLMIAIALFVSSLITQPWFTLGFATFLYALSIPYGVVVFLRERKKYREENPEEE